MLRLQGAPRLLSACAQRQRPISAWFSFSFCDRWAQWPGRDGLASSAYCLNPTCRSASALACACPWPAWLF